MKKKQLILLSFSVFIMMTGCKENKQAKIVERPVRVTTVSADSNNHNKIVLPASINELKEVKLAFRVGGPLVKLNNIVGSYVEKGDVIAQIDPRDFKLAVTTAETSYLQAKAQYERYKNLLDKKSVSKSLFDQMEANYKLSKANFERAKNSLIDTDLKAPFSGYLNTIFTENFEKVKPGAPIVSLLDYSNYEVNAWISPQDKNKINSETEYFCVINNGETYRLKGKLKEIGTKSSHSKLSYPLSILVDVPEKFKLSAGMTANLDIIFKSKKYNPSFLIPVTSVFSKETETCVWIFDEQTNSVSLKSVKIGKIVSDKMLSVTEGLKESDLVVTAGVHYLTEGQKVKRLSEFSKSNVGNQL